MTNYRTIDDVLYRYQSRVQIRLQHQVDRLVTVQVRGYHELGREQSRYVGCSMEPVTDAICGVVVHQIHASGKQAVA